MSHRVIAALSRACLSMVLAACATSAGPQVKVVAVATPTPVSCVPADSPPPPAYADTPDALKTAPDFASRYGLMAAAYGEHLAREAYLEALRASCSQAGRN